MSAQRAPLPHYWKPGQSGNPNGRPKKAVEADKIRYAKYAELLELLGKFCEMTSPELTTFIARKEATNFELIYGKLVTQAAGGDKTARLEFSERLLGKPKEAPTTEELTEDELARQELASLGNAELLQLLKNKIPELEEKKSDEGSES